MEASTVLWFGNLIDAIIGTYLAGAINQVMAYVTPAAALLIVTWAAWTGYKIAASEVPQPAQTVMFKLVKLGLLVAIATGFNIYNDVVVGAARGMADGLVGAFNLEGGIGSGTSVWTSVNDFDRVAQGLPEETLARAGFGFEKFVATFWSAIFMLITGLLEIVAAAVAAISIFALTFGLAVGPAFVLTLMFDSTKQFFFNWVGLLASCVVLNWICHFALGVSMTSARAFVRTALEHYDEVNMVSIVGGHFFVCGVMALLLWQAPTIASGLSGGSPLQLGAQMVSQIAMAIRMGSAPKAPPKPDANNTIAPKGLSGMASAGARHLYERIADMGRCTRK